jgi:hypothetical protein
MKVGDIVKVRTVRREEGRRVDLVRVGLVVDIVEKKCWRTHTMGKRIDWNAVKPEPHAVVVVNGDQRTVPVTDLELFK